MKLLMWCHKLSGEEVRCVAGIEPSVLATQHALRVLNGREEEQALLWIAFSIYLCYCVIIVICILLRVYLLLRVWV